MDYTKMKTGRLFLRYVIPQMIGLVFNSVYFIVDGVFIGRRLGPAALASAGVAVPVVEIMIALSMLIAVGAGVQASACAGKGDAAGARRVFNQSVRFALVFSVLLALAGGLFARPLSALLGANEALIEGTAVYLRIFMLFSPFLVFSYMFSTFVRNDGRPKLAMVSLVIGALSNILLDWVFMYPLDMGMAGAALATGLGPVFSVLILLPHFLRRRGGLWFARAPFSPAATGRMLACGLPAFVAEFSIGLTTLLYNLAIVKNGLGEDGLTSYMVIGYAALIFLTAFLGAAQGLQPPVSWFTAAGDDAKVGALFKAAVVFCLGLGVLFYAVLFFGGGAFFSIFLAEEMVLIRQTVGYARLYFLCLPLAGVNILVVTLWQAMGRTVSSLILSLCRVTLPLVVFLGLFPLLFGPSGLWLAVTGAEALTLLVALPLGLSRRHVRRVYAN